MVFFSYGLYPMVDRDTIILIYLIHYKNKTIHDIELYLGYIFAHYCPLRGIKSQARRTVHIDASFFPAAL